MPPDAAPPLDDPAAGENTSWDPFESRIDFDFAWFHFVEAESSAAKINQAINMWAATILQQGGSPPWNNAKGMYQTIDEIQHGDAPWKTFIIRYQGPVPAGVPPKWMTVDYELCLRDTRQVLHHQLNTVDYCDKINYQPYQQFNGTGKRVYSNLMSGDWAWSQAVGHYKLYLGLPYSLIYLRTKFPKTRPPMVPSFFQ